MQLQFLSIVCINKLIKYKFIDKKFKASLYSQHYVDTRVKGLVKTHKLNFSLRPIVDNIGSPVFKYFSKTLDKYKGDSIYDVKNSYEFREIFINMDKVLN